MNEKHFILTKEEFDRIYEPTILKADYDNTIKKIELRVGYIWPKLLSISNRKLKWWDFDNEAGEGAPGYFSPLMYKETISLTGEYSRQYDSRYYKYTDSLPTEFLWTEDNIWQEKVLKNIDEAITKNKLDKEKTKEKREALKLKKAEMKELIKSKLTKEELKFISFLTTTELENKKI